MQMTMIHKLVSGLDKLLTVLYRPLTKLAIGTILLTIFYVSCVQVIDRSKFYGLVKTTAVEEAQKRINNSANDSITIVCNSLKAENANDSSIINRRFIISYTNNDYSPMQKNNPDESLLDVLSKSDGLINTNGLTYCVTLIVTLLASLLLYRIETMDKLVEENRALVYNSKEIQTETKSYYTHVINFDNILTRIESAYNMTMLIGNTATMLLHARTDDESTHISTNIAHLCTRLSLLCSEIDDRLNRRKSRVDFLSVDEKSILDMYLEDAHDALKRSLSLATRFRVIDLCTIIEGNINSVQDILEAIDEIELKETVLK